MLRVSVVTSNIAGWVRDAASAINGLIKASDTINATAVIKDGLDIYTTTTLTTPPTQAELQAIADALAAVSLRLKG